MKKRKIRKRDRGHWEVAPKKWVGFALPEMWHCWLAMCLSNCTEVVKLVIIKNK